MKHSTTIITVIVTLISICSPAFSQVKEVKPAGIRLLNFSPEGEKEYRNRIATAVELYEKLDGDQQNFSNLTESEQEQLYLLDYGEDSYYTVSDIGCSWYCGGGPENVTASSFLSPQGKNTYEPQNAHDDSYASAWVEGAKGNGVGEYLTYHFTPYCPRITTIIIANGYVKSQEAWENNGRVKKLKMYVNEEPYAILLLEDSRSEQSFVFPPIGNRRDEDNSLIDEENVQPWTLKFEILEVYKGKKYSDVAISELYFDGIDVHCFAAGTPVNMANGTTKPIEEVAAGDLVMVYDFRHYKLAEATVEEVQVAEHGQLVKYTFEGGKELVVTPDHPFMVQRKGWASLEPQKSLLYGFERVEMVEEGDLFFAPNKEGQLSSLKLISIEYIQEEQPTYTISKLGEYDNFIANGFIVGVEQLTER